MSTTKIVNYDINVVQVRLYPNKNQELYLSKLFGCCRFVFNNSLASIKEFYKNEKKFIWKFDLINRLPSLKQENVWLKEVDSTALQNACVRVDNSLKNFINSKKGKRNGTTIGFPKFKTKWSKQSATLINSKIDLDNNRIKIPKLTSWIKFKGLMPESFKNRISIQYITINKRPSGKYYCSITYRIIKQYPNHTLDLNKSIGIDFGLKTFLTLSNGEKIDSPQYFKKSQKKLAKLQRKHSRKKTNSKNKEKARLKLAKLHENVSNQRKDFNHKLSRQLVNNNDFIFIEDLNLQGMMKKLGGQKISDLSYYQLTSFIDYKAKRGGKYLVKIDRYFPSSKLCNRCGFKNETLQLKDREWVCPNCGCCHDRDLNASINLLNEGLKHLTNTVGSTEINACPNSNELKICKFTDYEDIPPYSQWRINKQELKLN